MTDVAIAQTHLTGAAAGTTLGQQVRTQLERVPDALIVFAAPGQDHLALLEGLASAAGTRTIVGCSSAGEFTRDESGQGLTNVTAIRAPSIRFSAVVGTRLAADAVGAARAMAKDFIGANVPDFPFRAALVLVDALAGHTEELIDALTVATAGTYRFFGGGAGDDARFERTQVFCGTSVYADAAVALEIASQKAVGIGARHGWAPASPPLRVTQADAGRLVSLNAAPAVEAFEEHAERSTQHFDRRDPMPFFLHNVVGVETPGGYKLRVPLGIAEDGSVVCAAEVPEGTTTHIMSTGGDSAAKAAAEA
ncbi:MAG TPA: FIST N-terminal domain-containing protein, partial [Steroidobacteraceae bacterium]|nr:FIST N-terminal domain-containing protein [Steroidobacteraceae bacterium]